MATVKRKSGLRDGLSNQPGKRPPPKPELSPLGTVRSKKPGHQAAGCFVGEDRREGGGLQRFPPGFLARGLSPEQPELAPDLAQGPDVPSVVHLPGCQLQEALDYYFFQTLNFLFCFGVEPINGASLVAQRLKCLPPMPETQV